MRYVAEITLVENSTAGNQPRIFAEQTVEVHHEADTVIPGVDGNISRGRHQSKVFWLGGTAKDLAHITNVRIVGNNGDVLIDGDLINTYGAPRDVAGGVKFDVLKHY
jgi:hypothetical protein